jgi:hypothetical protein
MNMHNMDKNMINHPNESNDSISHAQADMCKAYANGSAGILSSGLVWLLASIVVFQYGDKKAVWALLIGGMFIHPLSILLSKLLGLQGAHAANNYFGRLAMEGTVFMLMCIPLAFGLSLLHTEWFFQGMLMIIGGRYLTFSSIYGKKSYWILGAVLGVSAVLLYMINAKVLSSVLTGCCIEIVFGIFMLINFRKQQLNQQV